MPKRKKVSSDGVMTLTDHLRELRTRIIICILALVVTVVFCLTYAGEIIDLFLAQGVPYGYRFVTLAPQEMIVQYFKVSFLGGIVLALPVLLYHLWGFFRPGLKKNENIFFFFAMIFGLICFFIGVLFAYKIALPFMLYFLINVNSTLVRASISVESYLSFVMTVYLIFGIVFEMPMVSIILTQFGLVQPEWLKAARPYMIVVIFIVAAIITPPDIFSQTMVALPMCLLYEISIWLSKLFRKRKVKKEEDEEEEERED